MYSVLPFPLISSLFSETEFSTDCTILFDVSLFELVQQTLSATYHLQKSTTRVVILLVCLEVLSKVVDAFCQKRNLYFWRTCVALFSAEFSNDFLFCHFCFLLVFYLPLSKNKVGVISIRRKR